MSEHKQDLSICPRCGGVADNGHDREFPPNPYFCTKCTPSLTSLTKGNKMYCFIADELI